MVTLWNLTPELRVQVLPVLPYIGADAENTHHKGGYSVCSSGAGCKPVVFGLDWCDSNTSHHTTENAQLFRIKSVELSIE